MKASKREWIVTVIQSVVLGAVVVTAVHFALLWLRNGGAVLLGI